MKSAVLLFVLACPLHAALLATVQTSQGDVVVDLQYTKAPQAVANFITLAQGSRTRVNQTTGAITNAPLYAGEKFFRVINETSFKIAQTGSGTGNNSGGPGYTFRDEFDSALAHVPYVLSMANSGPNTNGSQIFFTGNVSIPSLDNVHTVFGMITEPASRAVIDSILAAGNDGASITGITFSRTDAAALAFDEHTQNLPTIIKPNGKLTVVPGVSATWNFNQPVATGSIFRAFRSTSVTDGWTELPGARQHAGLDDPAVNEMLLDDAAASKAFYHLSVAHHPGSVTPSSLINRTATIPLGEGTLTYSFNATGLAGITTYLPDGGTPFGGAFSLINAPSFDAHNLTFIADTPSINPRYLLIKIGCDSASASQITGHHSIEYYDSFYGWRPFASGSITISR